MYMLTNFNMLFKNVCRWETDFFISQTFFNLTINEIVILHNKI